MRLHLAAVLDEHRGDWHSAAEKYELLSGVSAKARPFYLNQARILVDSPPTLKVLQVSRMTAVMMKRLIRRKRLDYNEVVGMLLYRTANAYRRSGQSAKARRFLEQAARLLFVDDVKRYGIGILHYKFKYWDYAVEELVAFSKRNPRNAELLNLISHCYNHMDQIDAATRYLTRAVTLDYTHETWHLSLIHI